jgi:hypothetical protein
MSGHVFVFVWVNRQIQMENGARVLPEVWIEMFYVGLDTTDGDEVLTNIKGNLILACLRV